ncbi:MAG: hypothetical protein EOR97_13655 [Mesorhizobium sp.]|nr:hypothetical protein EOB49_34980 [Mesorhizobium sp. M7A.F.Ca.MR.148.00.0.0]RWN31212.1 MAG: hypothetical protein EOR97_13655 [Mesorhizobium sp.]
MALQSSDGVGEAIRQTRRLLQDRHKPRGQGRPPLRRASLATSPPIDGVEERRAFTGFIPLPSAGRRWPRSAPDEGQRPINPVAPPAR